jgi:serine/threonine-protein kinase
VAGPTAGKSAMIVGRYAIHDEIASGGMATVYFGKLVGPVGFTRAVAIKRLHPHFAKDPEFVAMFLDEARLAARIRHPNVVPTLDVVSTEGELFLVMEYVHGEPLHRMIRRVVATNTTIPPRIVASLFAGALLGLHAAHETKDERGHSLGIVHRDVSPHNLMVGADGVTRVLDFGVAKAAGRLQMTREGQLKGKLAYMAPEQLGAGIVNRLTDIYAAGVCLWETLTCKRLFEADSEGQLIQKVLEGRWQPPTQVVRSIPRAFDDIVARALDKDPSKRFQSARELAIALERSGDLAPASEVGEWVESIAREELDRRAAKLAEMESDPLPSDSQRQLLARKNIDGAPVDDFTVVGKHPAPPTSGPAPSVVPPATSHERSSERTTSERKAHLGFDVGGSPGLTRRGEREPGSPGISSRTSVSQKTARRRILVIDDSEVMLSRIKAALANEGYDVVTTTQAVGNARHIPNCDLVIIDYHMPGIDGGTVIRSLKSAAHGMDDPPLFYLYTSDPTVAKKHAELGFDGVFGSKGDQTVLVRDVKAVFRMLQMRAMKKKA